MTRIAMTRIRLSELGAQEPADFTLETDANQRAAMAERLGIRGIKKLRFTGSLSPEGRRDWRLDAQLGATVVQDCVVTLDPVSTRIEESVLRRYTANPPVTPADAEEVEMPEDDTIEPLPETLDLAAVMEEALALALPAFPRKEGVEPVEAAYTEPGKEPLKDDDLKPFAGLAALRDSLEKEGPDET